MESNFEFLLTDPDLQEFYSIAKDTEDLYTQRKFDSCILNLRKIAENMADLILDQKYIETDNYATFSDRLKLIVKNSLVDSEMRDMLYQVKNLGNRAAHTFNEFSQNETLEQLSNVYKILLWLAVNYYDFHGNIQPFAEPHAKEVTYDTSERKLIYIQTADNSNGQWPQFKGLEKIGDASVDDFDIDARPNSDDLRKVADKRINSYMETAGIKHDLQWAEMAYSKKVGGWFRDHAVHDVLERSGYKKAELGAGKEWFRVSLDTAKAAIQAVKEGKTSIQAPKKDAKITIVLRPEQAAAVKKTKDIFNKKNKKAADYSVLWNAKMRFGKTLSTFQLIKEEKFEHVLIMTHRPIVDKGWYEDFNKLDMVDAGYIYGSKAQGESFEGLKNSNKSFVYFASLQDLRGSAIAGGKQGDKNEDLFHTHWDLVVIDEAHEGTQTDLAQNVLKLVKSDDTFLLELSGTPFNIMDKYDADHVYTWDYVMEQQAKYRWEVKHPDKPNPYAGLPKVNMFTFEMSDKFKEAQFTDERKSFNFKEFFRVDENGKFVYEDRVRKFLDNITHSGTTNYPFSTRNFRNNLRHTLWILPGVKEANALEDLMKEQEVFKEYKIINVVRGDISDNELGSDNDADKVLKAMGNDPAETKTITLTVRRLTTGTTVPPWTGVVFLSNTSSAMQYLQAAFRAQTPYSSETFGVKTNCYIFDFAPDRALKVMAESANYNSGVGKINSKQQENQISELLNFLPIIGETGQGMQTFKVDKLLTQLKRVYAEKAVKTGFDDDSLYNDKLLTIDSEALGEFNNLKAIVGSTKAEKKKMKIQVNNQGLSEEEYNRAERAKRKKKKDRSPAEQAAIDKENELKKQKKALVSVLRGISIRIPLMIYGMKADVAEDVDINKFIQNVDDVSWEEFMPKGISKEMFKRFSRYYDEAVFIEAGKIIRQKVKDLDKADPLERVEKLALIFGTFRNPDKETVLTPWRVVNMQLGKTIGGYNFFDQDYKYTTVNGVNAQHWIETEYTNQVFSRDAHVLEINAKTGLYPLYAATSIYWKEYNKLNSDTAGKFSFQDQLFIWQKVLRENIFVIAKTPMARAITQRTLAGFRDFDTNILYEEDIVKKAKENVNQEAEAIRKRFGYMKFDVVIGNPPYQEETSGTRSSQKSIYYLFMKLAYQLSDLSILITPARFLSNGGDTPADFNKFILNSDKLKLVLFEKDSNVIFPRTDIKGGVAITLYDYNKSFEPIKLFIPFEQLRNIYLKVKSDLESQSLTDIIYPANKLNLENLYSEFPEDRKKVSSNGKERRLQSNIFKLDSIHEERQDNDFGIYGLDNKKKRIIRYIKRSFIDTDFKNNIREYKVVLPKSNGSGTLGEKISSPMIGKPMIGYTYTFIGVGKFNNIEEAEACLKYVKTKFARAMLGILKITQDNTPEKWKYVPLQNFTENSDIDWSKSIPEIDQQLYKKYGLTEDEINFIETKVQAMD